MEVANLCRSCMVEIATWECEDADQNTMEMFSFCTNIEVSQDDKLPRHFCYNCTVLLESSYAYIRTARRVNGKLKKLVQNGCINFVNDFLNKTNSADQIVFKERERFDHKNNIIPSYIDGSKLSENIVEKVTANDLDHLFDDDDDRCLSEFKSENEVKIEIKAEPKENNDIIQTEEIPVADIHNSVAENSKILVKPSCNICKKEFSSDGWLSRHMKTVHTEKAIKKKKLTTINKKKKLTVHKETKDTGDPNNDIKCRVCDKKFVSKQARTKHLNDEHSSTVDGQRVFLCPYCPKTFTKYSHMYYHTTSHPDLAKHPCKTCGKVYRIRKELDQHMRTHLKDRPYACDKCDMRFKVKGILATHLKGHEGIRPYLCSICGHSFSQSGNLESHMRVHTGEQPYACNQCSFRTTSNVSLKRHELRHRGERPYPCTYCPKRFYESCSLGGNRYRLLYETVSLKTPLKRFYESCSLTRHLRCHTRERPYRCPYCSREYFDSGKRRRHLIMTHKMAPDEIPPMDKAGNPIDGKRSGPRVNNWSKEKAMEESKIPPD